MLIPCCLCIVHGCVDTRCHILTVFRDLLPHLPAPHQYLAAISQMFMTLEERQSRTLIGDVLLAIASRVPDLQSVVRHTCISF